MNERMTKMLLMLVLVMDVAALPSRPKHIPRYIFGRPYGGVMNQIDLSSREDSAIPFDCDETSYFEAFILQPVDHFSNLTSYWPQFYQYNSKFYNGSSNLVFFMLGGDAPIESKWVCKNNIPYITWAKQHGAAVFQAEHRYFGYSRPKPTLTVANLKWLTPKQILADFNNFIRQMNKRYFGEKQMRWVLFGGSYAGTLAAWMRVKYPKTSIGAIASSSPLKLLVDNYSLAVNMRINYGCTNHACAKNIGAAFKQIQSMLYSISGRSQLEYIFSLCTDFPRPQKIRPKDLQFFWTNIFNVFLSLNQYSGHNRGNYSAETFGMLKACEIMNDISEPNLVLRVRNVIRWVSLVNGEEEFCTPNDYDAYITKMSNVSYDEMGHVGAARVWMYQCCSYLGYFATTDGGYDNNIWGSMIPLNFYVDQCIDMFGPEFNLNYTSLQVKKYRSLFGAAEHYKGSKCIFSNGNMDPWFSLGLLQGQENWANKVFAVTVDGGTHCSDMFSAQARDSASLKIARTVIGSGLDAFIRAG